MRNAQDKDELRRVVASWNSQKRDAADRTMLVGMTAFTDLHNERTRALISFIGHDLSPAWWEGLTELAANAVGMIKNGTVTPGVRVIDSNDVKIRAKVNGQDVGA